jgi:hypothetical protein
MSEMNTNKQIIAALDHLEAFKEQLETKEWLAERKRMGLDLDPENVDVLWDHAQVLDPYGICPSFPKAIDQIGREYFVRAPKSEIWVSFDDLPKTTVDRLWQRMRAGEFDEPISAADCVGPVTLKPMLAAFANSHGMSPDKMFWQPTEGPLGALIAGRMLLRSTNQSRGSLIVKDTDPNESLFVLTINEGGGCFGFAGWMSVRTAKQIPVLTAHGATAHFVNQNELNNMDDLKQFLTCRN